jgi:thioredoxin 1
VHFAKVDIEEVPDLAEDLGITSMPTLLLMKNGEKLDSVKGPNPLKIGDFIAKLL